MRTSTIISLPILLKLAMLFIKASADRAPTPYPKSFVVSFVTNVTEADATHPVGGHLYFDWNIQSQRIDHDAGAYECVHFYQTESPCSLYFVQGSMYRLLYDDHPVKCCLDLPVGTPPPDWANRANPTFNGRVLDSYSDIMSYQWTFDNLVPPLSPQAAGVSNYHTASEVASGEYAGLPLTFTFPGHANGTQDYHFVVESMATIPLPPSLFELPEGCMDVACDASFKSTAASAS